MHPNFVCDCPGLSTTTGLPPAGAVPRACHAECLQPQLPQPDLVIGGGLIPGAAAPKIVNRSMVALLRGSVLVLGTAAGMLVTP